MTDERLARAAVRPTVALEPPPWGVASLPRPSICGKSLHAGGGKFFVRGVTYGTFRPDAAGQEYPSDAVVAADFAAMTAHGLNAIRTYTVPPRRVLDAAAAHGLRVLIGVPWEQHVTFLDEPQRAREIEARVRAEVRACAGHPAVLAYSVGNEIPAPIVRWHGPQAVERFLRRLCEAAREEDPGALVTYVNYPTTEYLELPFLDFVCFNVYLESPERYQAYVARLQNLAGDRPLVMAEIGLDSRRHGRLAQARAVEWQLRDAFAGGCAGAFVFAWTDEWHRGGFDVEDWDFGLTDRQRRTKPALLAARRALEEVPFAKDFAWPRVSVVVCSYNGSRTIRHTLESFLTLQYPDFEVIVVDDGSTDTTATIAHDFGVRLISTPNRGLSNARNTGLEAATGDIVAYIDDDAYADPHWLSYLVATLMRSDHVGVGGPNLPPPGDGPIAEAVARAPGGPIHVLLSDTEAEHIPGCNMVFWKSALQRIGGFDPRFRSAGDDVDLCWRLQAAGGTIGFHPAAVVWHHRRNSVRAYWRQQRGYGRAEALLEPKWPDKYNGAGYATWSGRVYGYVTPGVWGRRIYHGAWGSALFQSVYQPAPGLLAALATLPEWPLLIGALTLIGLLGVSWPPLFAALLLAALAATLPLGYAGLASLRATRNVRGRARVKAWALTALLHVLQPMARLRGRLEGGLSPWRRSRVAPWVRPQARVITTWTEQWEAPDARLTRLESRLHRAGCSVRRGSDWDRWDLEVAMGPLGHARVRLVAEEHGAGRQLARFRVWPRVSAIAAGAVIGLLALAVGAAVDDAWLAATALGVVGLGLGAIMARACGTAVGVVLAARSAVETARQKARERGHAA